LILYQTKNNSEVYVTLLIGLGLVGSAIDMILAQDENNITRIKSKQKLAWADIDKSRSIIQDFIEENSQGIKTASFLNIIWSAGKIGFGGSELDAENELEFFKQFIDTLNENIQAIKNLDFVQYLMISSAGGLYEGQLNFSNPKVYSPQRPYGRLKLLQEKYLSDQSQNPTFVRLSAVYSTTNFGGRLGLIPTLFLNGIHNKVTRIFGNQTTLRDYILDLDVAKGINRIISEKDHSIKYHLFASGHSISIFQMKTIIERIICKKIYFNFEYLKTNDLSMAYSSKVISNHFQNTDLNVNLKILYQNILH